MSDIGIGNNVISDSDSGCSSLTSEHSTICRDFIRNVCQRPFCKFVHPENLRVRDKPIFCHDFQQDRCYRTSCKFIHCSKEDEEYFKENGRLPNCVGNMEYTDSNRISANKLNGGFANGMEEEMPICKDFLKGLCERGPGGCKYRHVVLRRPSAPSCFTPHTPGMRRPLGGPNARRGDEPPSKRFQLGPEYYEEYEPPPPPYLKLPPSAAVPGSGGNPSGYVLDHYATMKALEDENFMLKRRIEELKSSNEFLLSQNAQLRLNNSLTAVATSVAHSPLAVSVSASGGHCSAAPSIIGITSSSLSGSQPLPTISISTLPTVTPVSLSSQSLSHPAATTQIYLPAPQN